MWCIFTPFSSAHDTRFGLETHEVVHANLFGQPATFLDLVKTPDTSLCRERGVNLHTQSFTHTFIEDVQSAEPTLWFRTIDDSLPLFFFGF
ncbi:hypothetical protein NT6N_26790 [Oceaniferula spumae]|uniref:Uncharacterized protein n=1 Tax=Oceaniferula spumae TaxID=2979115 RepID=A0AAT9FP13_9BACT